MSPGVTRTEPCCPTGLPPPKLTPVSAVLASLSKSVLYLEGGEAGLTSPLKLGRNAAGVVP